MKYLLVIILMIPLYSFAKDDGYVVGYVGYEYWRSSYKEPKKSSEPLKGDAEVRVRKVKKVKKEK